MPKRGRPSKYKPAYAKKIVLYFTHAPKTEEFVKERFTRTLKTGTVEITEKFGRVTAPFPTFEKFARMIKVNGDTIVEWANATTGKGKQKKLKYPDFSAAYNLAHELQKEWLIDIGLQGAAPPASFIFVAKNVTNMKDKQDIDLSSKGKRIEGFNYVIPEKPKELPDGNDNANN